MGRDGVKLGPLKPLVKARRTEPLRKTMSGSIHKKGGAEAEEICEVDEVSAPSDSGERVAVHENGEGYVDVTRSELENSVLAQTPEAQRRAEQRESDIEAVLQEVGELLEQDTLETDLEAFRLLRIAKVQAAQRYEDIHTNTDPKEKKNFSEVSPKRINSFARHTLERVELDDKSLVYVMGSGFFNDDLHFLRNSRAHVVGVDNSETAIATARKYIDVMDKECALEWIEGSLKGIAGRHGQSFDKTRDMLLAMAARNTCIAKKVRNRVRIGPKNYRNNVAEAIGLMNSARNRIQFIHDDYINVLRSSSGMGIDMIYSNSSFHYFPPHMLRELIFPMVAAALRDRDGNVTGKFCLAMKLTSSASAQSDNQVKLAPNSPFDPSYDETDELFRIYLRSKEEMAYLLEPSFDVRTEEIEVVPSPDYDKTGDTEMMCQSITMPKVA